MRRLFAFALVCGMTSGAPAQVIWDNGPPGGPPFSSQIDNCYVFNSQTADDFNLPTGPGGETRWSITDVIWSGGYWNGSPFPGDFRILFYADAGGMPTGGPNDPTGTALAVYDFTFAEVNETPNSVGGYDYNATLPTPFTVDALTTYWFVAQSRMCFPPQWGFARSQFQQMSALMFGGPLFGYRFWTPSTLVFGLPYDASFQLWGTPHGGDCPGMLCGDANCDEAFNGADIDPFFLALGDPAEYRRRFPDCDMLCVADINGDGAVNGADIDPFFQGLGSGSCP